MANATKVRKPKQRFFGIRFSIDGTEYQVSPLPVDPAIGKKGFRFCKMAGDGEVYDLYLGEFGLQCQCKGFLRHGHCKHMETLQAANRIFNLQ